MGFILRRCGVLTTAGATAATTRRELGPRQLQVQKLLALGEIRLLPERDPADDLELPPNVLAPRQPGGNRGLCGIARISSVHVSDEHQNKYKYEALDALLTRRAIAVGRTQAALGVCSQCSVSLPIAIQE